MAFRVGVSEMNGTCQNVDINLKSVYFSRVVRQHMDIHEDLGDGKIHWSGIDLEMKRKHT